MRLRLYLRSARDHASRAAYGGLFRKASDILYSESAGIVVHKDLSGPDRARKPGQDRRVRPATLDDVMALIGPERRPDLDADELWERRLRHHVATTFGVEGCYVADAAEGGPAFMQYLFTARDDARVQSSFSGLFPVLAPGEAIVEFLYVAPESRNPGFVVECLLQVTDEARACGASSVISFIDPTNKGALFVNHLAGFTAKAVRRSRNRFFRRSYSFEDWPPETSRSLVDVASGRVTIR